MQMTWSSSLNHWRNYKRSWSSGRLTWKERDFGSTWAKPRSWFLGQDSMCFGNPAKTPVVCVSKTSTPAPFSVFFFFSWVHKRYSGIPGPLKPDPSFMCKRCTGQDRPDDGRPMTGGRAWGGAILLLPRGQLILRWRLWTHFHHKMPGQMGQIQWVLVHLHTPLIYHHLHRKSLHLCVRGAMLHASETWAPTLCDLHRLQCNNRALIRLMCGATIKDQVSSQDFLDRMQLDDVAKVVCTCWLRWTAIYNVVMVGWMKSRNAITHEVVGVASLRKPEQKWSAWTALR